MLLFKLQFSALKIEKESCQHICYGLRWNPLGMSSQWLGDNSIHILRNFPNFSEITFYFQVNLLSSWCWINESRILYKDIEKNCFLCKNLATKLQSHKPTIIVWRTYYNSLGTFLLIKIVSWRGPRLLWTDGGAPVREQSNIQPHWADTNHGRVARGR